MFSISQGFDGDLKTGRISQDLKKAFYTTDHVLIKKFVRMDFSLRAIKGSESYKSNRYFPENAQTKLSNEAYLNYGAFQGSICGPLIFYFLRLHMAIFPFMLITPRLSSKGTTQRTYIYEYFVDDTLTFYFYKDKTTSILVTSRHKSKSIGELNFSYGDIKVKHYLKVLCVCVCVCVYFLPP